MLMSISHSYENFVESFNLENLSLKSLWVSSFTKIYFNSSGLYAEKGFNLGYFVPPPHIQYVRNKIYYKVRS